MIPSNHPSPTLADLQKSVAEHQELLQYQIERLQLKRSLIALALPLVAGVYIVLMSIPRLRELIAMLLLLPFAALAAYGFTVIAKDILHDRS